MLKYLTLIPKFEKIKSSKNKNLVKNIKISQKKLFFKSLKIQFNNTFEFVKTF